jgi:hypothetical protein
MPMLDRANDLLERADKLDDAVSNLQAFRSLLEDLNARTPIDLPSPQVQAIGMVRAAIFRSAIALVFAILDSKGSDRVSLGQIAEILKDHTFVQFLEKKLHEGRGAIVDRLKLQALIDLHQRIYDTARFCWVKQLRHDEIGHLLMRKASTPTVEYSDVFALADVIERLVALLHEGLGIHAPHFTTVQRQTVDHAKLFWNTYFAGVVQRA